MVFALAGTDVSALEPLMRATVREVCMLYLNRLRQDAKENYDRALMVWSNTASFGKSKPPDVPQILR